MKTDLTEDTKDSQGIRKQKEEQKRSREEMANWDFGKGVMKNKDDKRHVQNKVQ